jgi:hypothetical protein
MHSFATTLTSPLGVVVVSPLGVVVVALYRTTSPLGVVISASSAAAALQLGKVEGTSLLFFMVNAISHGSRHGSSSR